MRQFRPCHFRCRQGDLKLLFPFVVSYSNIRVWIIDHFTITAKDNRGFCNLNVARNILIFFFSKYQNYYTESTECRWSIVEHYFKKSKNVHWLSNQFHLYKLPLWKRVVWCNYCSLICVICLENAHYIDSVSEKKHSSIDNMGDDSDAAVEGWWGGGVGSVRRRGKR